MANTSIKLSQTFPVSAQELYDAWLNSETHSEFTGSSAEIDPSIGGEHFAWDGYIWGKTVELDSGKRILQTWRTTEFADSDPDSSLELLFEDTSKGGKIYINHWNIPEGQADAYLKGWNEYYFEPMLEYFGD